MQIYEILLRKILPYVIIYKQKKISQKCEIFYSVGPEGFEPNPLMC